MPRKKYTAEQKEQAFWRKVEKAKGCWKWMGATLSSPPYGVMCWSGKSILAHRFSHELANGPIPEGMSVLHTCDNSLCVNPEHLYLGTNRDNQRDKGARGRTVSGWETSAVSQRESLAKRVRVRGKFAEIPAEQQAEAVRLFVEDGLNQNEIARRLGISSSSVAKYVQKAGIHIPAMWRKTAPERVTLLRQFNEERGL